MDEPQPVRCPKCGRLVHPMELYPNDSGCGCTPRRVQRQRKRGQPGIPKGAVYIGRGSKWGNPWVVHRHTPRCGPEHVHCPVWLADDRVGAARAFRHAVLYPLIGQPSVPTPDEIRAELRGRDLACWCALDQPCHGDFYLEIANG